MTTSIYQRISLAVAISAILFAQRLSARRMWPQIRSDLRLFEMAYQLRTEGLEALAEEGNITMFLPSSEAFFRFSPAASGVSEGDHWSDLLHYSTVMGRWRLSEIRKKDKMASKLYSNVFLFVNTFNTKNGPVTTINGAKIIHADIVTDNGIIHIVDMFIAPIGSPKTIADYLIQPEIPHLEFKAIVVSRNIVPALAQATNSTKRLYTSFSPNDSYLLPMPEYGRTQLFDNIVLLQRVYMSHMVQNEALFLPHSMIHLGKRTSMATKNGLIHFYRWKDQFYVVNNRVHAKVIYPNIPTSNGVIHVIDNLLHYIYRNAVQMAKSHPDAKVWGQLMGKLSNSAIQSLTDKTVTLFLPTDVAFSKMPLFYQAELRQENQPDMAMLQRVLFGHFVANMEFDFNKLGNGKTITLMNNQTLTVRHVRDDIYLETADQRVRSKVEVVDIGINNGVVHLVSNVLFADNYTIWQALGDIPTLSRIHKRLLENFPELHTLMSKKQPITVFLPSNAVLKPISDHLDFLLAGNSEVLLQALRGHIVTDQMSSSQLTGNQTHTSWSGEVLRTSWSESADTISVSGGHVTGRVILSDIYCSNGVLHIIDDLLFVPTRTIWAELEKREDMMKYFKHMIMMVNDPAYDLNDKRRNYTVFVPMNEAYAYLPWLNVDRLLTELDWTKEVMKAHVVPDESRPLEEIPSNVGLVAEKNLIYVKREEDRVYVVNNNMMAKVVHHNLPAINGWIHVIDRILTVPYVTVAQTMMSQPELRAFHKLMQSLPEYQELLKPPDSKSEKKKMVTLFVPSTRYINTLEPDQLDNIRSNMNIIRKLFYGHVLPDVRMDEEFLRQYDDKDYVSRTVYNMSFTISKKEGEMYVGVGFDIQTLDLVGRGMGCSDGVIHVIHGFLNYSPFTVWERLQREPTVSQSFEQFYKLASPADRELLNNHHRTFTFLMPDDQALDYFTFTDLMKMHSLPGDEQQRIFWRHVINDSTVLYDDLRNGYTSAVTLPSDVSINVDNEAVHVKYGHVNSRIKTWNLITCNGVIHIIKQYLYDINMQNDSNASVPTPRTPQSTKTPAPLQRSHVIRASKYVIVTSFVTWLVLCWSLWAR